MLTLDEHHQEYWYVAEYRFEFADNFVEFADYLVEVADYLVKVVDYEAIV